MRTVITIIAWICYLISINVYIFTFNTLNQFVSKLIYLWPSFLLLIFCGVEILLGFASEWHRTFIVLCFSALALNFLLMIMYFQFGIADYQVKFYTFNVVELITAFCLLISGSRRGLFKNED